MFIVTSFCCRDGMTDKLVYRQCIEPLCPKTYMCHAIFTNVVQHCRLWYSSTLSGIDSNKKTVERCQIILDRLGCIESLSKISLFSGPYSGELVSSASNKPATVVSMHSRVLNNILNQHQTDFHQIYSIDAFWERDEYFRFLVKRLTFMVTVE